MIKSFSTIFPVKTNEIKTKYDIDEHSFKISNSNYSLSKRNSSNKEKKEISCGVKNDKEIRDANNNIIVSENTKINSHKESQRSKSNYINKNKNFSKLKKSQVIKEHKNQLQNINDSQVFTIKRNLVSKANKLNYEISFDKKFNSHLNDFRKGRGSSLKKIFQVSSVSNVPDNKFIFENIEDDKQLLNTHISKNMLIKNNQSNIFHNDSIKTRNHRNLHLNSITINCKFKQENIRNNHIENYNGIKSVSVSVIKNKNDNLWDVLHQKKNKDLDNFKYKNECIKKVKSNINNTHSFKNELNKEVNIITNKAITSKTQSNSKTNMISNIKQENKSLKTQLKDIKYHNKQIFVDKSSNNQDKHNTKKIRNYSVNMSHVFNDQTHNIETEFNHIIRSYEFENIKYLDDLSVKLLLKKKGIQFFEYKRKIASYKDSDIDVISFKVRENVIPGNIDKKTVKSQNCLEKLQSLFNPNAKMISI